jgi:hypothetical protein
MPAHRLDPTAQHTHTVDTGGSSLGDTASLQTPQVPDAR